MPQRSKTSEVSRDTAAIVRSRRGDDSRLSSELMYKDGSVARVEAGSLDETKQLLMVCSLQCTSNDERIMIPAAGSGESHLANFIAQASFAHVWQLPHLITAAETTEMIKL